MPYHHATNSGHHSAVSVILPKTSPPVVRAPDSRPNLAAVLGASEKLCVGGPLSRLFLALINIYLIHVHETDSETPEIEALPDFKCFSLSSVVFPDWSRRQFAFG